MTESRFFCPVSARLTAGNAPLYTPIDVPPGRLGEDGPDLAEIAVEVGERIGIEDPASSDACFAAFAGSPGVVLVSREPFDVLDLEEITADLIGAVAHRELTGVRRVQVTGSGHVFVWLDFQPVCGLVSTPGEIRALFDDLKALHAAGLVHGGINDRFINPSNPTGRRVFGTGLASAYAAWRRAAGIELGDLTADPRFASPGELSGEGPSEEGDRFALAAIAVTEMQAGDDAGATAPVQGINAFLDRSGARASLLSRAEELGDRTASPILKAALEGAPPKSFPIWRAGLAALAVLLLAGQCMQVMRRPAPAPAPVIAGGEVDPVRCNGPGVQLIGDECRLDANVGRCGDNTYFDPMSASCLAIAPRREANDDPIDDTPRRRADTGAVASAWIHPVMECNPSQRLIVEKISFSNDDINLSIGEKGTIARQAAYCQGEAEVIYYTSVPGLEDRARTIYEEFRSSSHCSDECRARLPEVPTAIVYVPYIGLIERANDHYLMFHCCAS